MASSAAADHMPGAPEHMKDEMTYKEKWWLQDLWEGRLRKAMDEAEGKCNRVQALRFSLHDQESPPPTPAQPQEPSMAAAGAQAP